MTDNNTLQFAEDVLNNMPADWLRLTTHRLDIYDESQAKTQFLDELQKLYQAGVSTTEALRALPTAYDYIRLGHPLSCVLEWTIARLNRLPPSHVISFSSQTTPLLAVLRANHLGNKRTLLAYTELPACFDADVLRRVYGYRFELTKVAGPHAIPAFSGSTVFITTADAIGAIDLDAKTDFALTLHAHLGSVLIVGGVDNERYISEIQHVRRRETIAMTPTNCVTALRAGRATISAEREAHKAKVLGTIADITGAGTGGLVASSGLSMQYAIMMGLVDDALENHKGKPIKIAIPPNCYGGTNDQARRVAACLDNVEIVDLPVDGDNDMVSSIDTVLRELAAEDAVPFIIAEIPTNPRVEVPDLAQLREVLNAPRANAKGEPAIAPVFILDQTFCPNVRFLGAGDILSGVKSLAYISGSKFPSGGRCTAGYCAGNHKAKALMEKVALHLRLCDNEATDLQLEILAEQMPSMTQRIADAYKNTREFVEFIHTTLPAAKVNFVSPALARQGFTPSVFSLDLPAQGDSDEEKEAHKRELNLRLINLMINQIPSESKFCVSYGQLKGCYWTIPATSTQGTTKESDKDYIVRASLSPNMDLERHKEVFAKFVATI